MLEALEPGRRCQSWLVCHRTFSNARRGIVWQNTLKVTRDRWRVDVGKHCLSVKQHYQEHRACAPSRGCVHRLCHGCSGTFSGQRQVAMNASGCLCVVIDSQADALQHVGIKDLTGSDISAVRSRRLKLVLPLQPSLLRVAADHVFVLLAVCRTLY